MKSDPEIPSSWEKLAAARRQALAALPLADDTAPFGFAPRLAARAMELRRHERLAWWTRWSMRAASGAGIVAALVFILGPADAPAPLLAAPSLEIPGFSSL